MNRLLCENSKEHSRTAKSDLMRNFSFLITFFSPTSLVATRAASQSAMDFLDWCLTPCSWGSMFFSCCSQCAVFIVKTITRGNDCDSLRSFYHLPHTTAGVSLAPGSCACTNVQQQKIISPLGELLPLLLSSVRGLVQDGLDRSGPFFFEKWPALG